MRRMIFNGIAVFALLFVAAGGGTSPVRAANLERCTSQYGQLLINQGRYKDAIREFTCLIESQPTEVEGYRGRIEALLLLGRYSDALRDYTRVTAYVEPVHPDAQAIILAGYSDRLAANSQDVPALMGISFARWYYFDYASAIHILNQLLVIEPDNLYGNLFRGSSRLLRGATREKGIADLERALAMAPESPDVRYIVADAYTYGLPDPERAFAEASRALKWGLDTPRVHAILASAYMAFGDQLSAAGHIKRHIDLVTTEFIPTEPITLKSSLTLELIPGRTYEIPISVTAGELVSIMTSSGDFYDTILVLLGPDGSPILGSDDYKSFFAGLDWVALQDGAYLIQVTSFESVNTGTLLVSRK